MTDIHSVLPDFQMAPYTHLLPSLDRNSISVVDLLSLEAVEIAKRAQLPPGDVARLADAVLNSLRDQLEVNPAATAGDLKQSELAESNLVDTDQGQTENQSGPNVITDTISTLDATIDAALAGGVRAGYVTEFTGESGAGKTQFLLSLLLSVQLPAPAGLGKSAIYISSEAALATSRLYQLLHSNERLCNLPAGEKPSLDRILSVKIPDLEVQDHILRYQLPVAIEQRDVGLVVIDSIAANFRAEFERPGDGSFVFKGHDGPERRAGKAMAERKGQLVQLGHYLRELARQSNIAIVVANQVVDRFTPAYSSQPTSSMMSTITPDPLTLDHQQRWFTGWGDLREYSFATNLKTPSLGLVWTNEIAARIALIKQTRTGGEGSQRRWLRVVFAPWCATSNGRGTEYEIRPEGVIAVASTRKEMDDDNEISETT